MSDLVPEEAIAAARDAVSARYEADAESDDSQIATAALEAAAPLILAAELEHQAALLIDKAGSFGVVPPNTSSSGAVIALRDTAEELRVCAADLREVPDVE